MAEVSQSFVPFDNPSNAVQHPPRSSSVPPDRLTMHDGRSADFDGAGGFEHTESPIIAPTMQPSRASQIIERNLEIARGGQVPSLYYTDTNGQHHASPEMDELEYKPQLAASEGLPEIAISSFDFGMQEEIGNGIERPATAASGDTYRQAQTLFHDFDGAHYAPSIRE